MECFYSFSKDEGDTAPASAFKSWAGDVRSNSAVRKLHRASNTSEYSLAGHFVLCSRSQNINNSLALDVLLSALYTDELATLLWNGQSLLFYHLSTFGRFIHVLPATNIHKILRSDAYHYVRSSTSLAALLFYAYCHNWPAVDLCDCRSGRRRRSFNVDREIFCHFESSLVTFSLNARPDYCISRGNRNRRVEVGEGVQHSFEYL
jgi:hypothetical protein